MSNTENGRRQVRDRTRGRELLPTDREVFLARMLLFVADRVAKDDRDQEFVELYNALKELAEPCLRGSDGS